MLCAGSFVCDLTAAGLPHVAEPGELVYAPNGIELNIGGHSANVAIDLAQLGQTSVAAVGCVGEDLFGEYIEDELRSRGIHAYIERLAGVSTAKNIALIVEGEDRRFIAELTANALLSTDQVMSALEEARPEIFFMGTVGGLRYIDESLVEVLGTVRSLGCLTVVDIIMPHEFGWDHITSALPMIDVLHCNELESSALTGVSDPETAADVLSDEGVHMIIITKGSEGLVAVKGTLKLAMPAFKVNAVDPTGSGDAFCAGFIDALLNASVTRSYLPSLPLDVVKRALLEGEAAGAACVSAVGATTNVTREAVDRLLQEQGDRIWAAARTIRGDLY